MYDLGLGVDDTRELQRLLTSSHALRIDINLLDLNHNHLGNVSKRFLSGSVDIDIDADVSRTCKLSLIDVDGSLNLDKNNPNDGTMYLDRMVQVVYCVGRMDRTKWFEIPIFTGPISKVDRDGVIVNVEADGKESMSGQNSWKAKTWRKGYKYHTIIRLVMASAGEKFMRLSDSKSKTGSVTALSRESSPFAVAKKLADAANMTLYYDGAGRLRLRPRSSNPVWKFDDKVMVTAPQIGYTLDGVINAVEVRGKKPPKKGNGKRPIVRAVAPASHPLSPQSLARGGVPRYIWIVIEDEKLKTVAECRRVANAKLERGLIETVDATFTSLPIPHLEEGDTYEVRTERYSGKASVKKMTIPLTSGDTMSVGYVKRVKPSRLSRRLGRK
jgi:hypothetical protein